MRAEQIGLSERSQHGKKWLGTTHLLAKILKSVRQGMANGKAKRTEPERIQENVHLMTHAHGAVLQVAIIKAQPGIEEYLLYSCARRTLNFPRKIFLHHCHSIAAEIEITHLTDIFALHVTD